MAALKLHSTVTDPAAHTAPARAAAPSSLAYWERKVDPGGVLPPAQRTRQAGYAKKAHFLDLAMKSAAARKAKKAAAASNDGPT